MVLRSTCVLAAVTLLALTSCRTSRIETRGTDVGSGDMLYGRLPAERSEQSFSFEGVESAVLDFTLRADEGSKAAPEVSLTDPEGRLVDLSASTGSAAGAATMKVRDVVLLRNGLYRLTVRPPISCQSTYYQFQHCMRFPTPAPRQVRLTACDEHSVFVSAPRGGLIAFEMRPLSGGVVPTIKSVKDPWGGRALDKDQVPPGALAPRVSHGHLGETVLTFTAPRPGKYTIVTAAEPGTAGVAQLSVQVRAPRGGGRVVNHPNTLPNYGLPGDRTPGVSANNAVRSSPLPPPPPLDGLEARAGSDVLAPPPPPNATPDSIAQR